MLGDNREKDWLQARVEFRVEHDNYLRGLEELPFHDLCCKVQGLHLRKGMMWAVNHSLDI